MTVIVPKGKYFITHELTPKSFSANFFIVIINIVGWMRRIGGL